MNNPYIYRGPVRTPEMFFGREHELREIAAFLNGNQSVSIIGPRKIGKTSLLFHLMRTEIWPDFGLENDTLLVYLDCEVLGQSEHGELFAIFASEIAAALDERDLPAEESLEAVVEKPTRLSFERAIRKLNKRGLRVVLILDEFERLSTNPHLDVNFFNALRSAAGRYQLAYMTASAQPLIQLTYSERSQNILSSPFFNIFAHIYLGLMPESESLQVIRQPAQEAGMPFASQTEAFLYGFVGGFPLGLQVACFHAFEVLQSNQAVDTYEIEWRTMQELTPHFEYYWHNLDASEQDTLRRLSAAVARAPSDTTLRGILRDLIQKCMLVSDGITYTYPMRAWANFINLQTMPSPLVPGEGMALTGTQLGPYQVLERLGRGGMAEVYKGRHPRLDRTVAIKVLPAHLANSVDTGQAEFARRFEREARAVATLRHANIVQIFDFGDIEGAFYMVMEFINGQDLGVLLQELKQLNLPQTNQILTQLGSALDYAHAQGFVHRDVKPSNVMLEPLPGDGAASSYRAILTDFGIAKILGGDTTTTKSGMLMGTLDYMAPEQIHSAGDVDRRADIYSLGVMTYQMLTGQVPFMNENPRAVMMSHLETPPPDPRDMVPELPEGAALAVQRAMAKDPGARFDKASQFTRELLI